MFLVFKRVYAALRKEGVAKTASKINHSPAHFLEKKRLEKIRTLDSIEKKFTWIYEHNHWKSGESVSGLGSTLEYTENLRKELPEFLSKFNIKKILDAPCGDFNWMRYLLPQIDVDYIGADVVKPLIDSLTAKYASAHISFMHLDLLKDKLPEADLMICRDCLFHLSYAEAKSALENFLASNIPYLLTTTHTSVNDFKNKDISTGDFRLMNLFKPPYNFPLPPIASIDDWRAPDPERQMCLWNRDQVEHALLNFGNETNINPAG
jgi:hypothetical protein